MLIEANDPRTVDVMGLFQHLTIQQLKDFLNEDSRLESIIKDSQMVCLLLIVYSYSRSSLNLILLLGQTT